MDKIYMKKEFKYVNGFRNITVYGDSGNVIFLDSSPFPWETADRRIMSALCGDIVAVKPFVGDITDWSFCADAEEIGEGYYSIPTEDFEEYIEGLIENG